MYGADGDEDDCSCEKTVSAVMLFFVRRANCFSVMAAVDVL